MPYSATPRLGFVGAGRLARCVALCLVARRLSRHRHRQPLAAAPRANSRVKCRAAASSMIRNRSSRAPISSF